MLTTVRVQVLQETEERVNRKMREVISQQPSAHTDAPIIRSPNKQASRHAVFHHLDKPH